MGGMRSGIRWREDVGWEVRCDSCARKANTSSYWPLTDEFWDPRRMTMCRACLRGLRRINDRRAYAADMEKRHKLQQKAREYRAASQDVIRLKRRGRLEVDAELQRHAYWSDPEKARAKSRDYYQRNRDRILEKRRASYAKAA